MNEELISAAHCQLNGSALAYVGDAVYEVAVRTYVLDQGLTQPNKLHRAAIKYVEASAQAYVIQQWLTQDLLNQDEIDIYRRGRNHKANTKAKNASIGDYRQATGFEALIGWLYLSRQTRRYHELMQLAIELINKRG